jgi:MFS superfamily sulfate permease-like transporter
MGFLAGSAWSLILLTVSSMLPLKGNKNLPSVIEIWRYIVLPSTIYLGYIASDLFRGRWWLNLPLVLLAIVSIVFLIKFIGIKVRNNVGENQENISLKTSPLFWLPLLTSLLYFFVNMYFD